MTSIEDDNMNQPRIKITYDDLELTPPLTYKILERHGMFGEFDPLELADSVEDICWFIASCELCRTAAMLKYVTSIGGSVFVIAKCLTKIYDPDYSLIDYFKQICRSSTIAGWLIANCEHSQTEEMIRFWKSLRPSSVNVWWLIVRCEYCQTEEMMDYLKTLSPDSSVIGKLIAEFDVYQTDEMRDYYYELTKDTPSTPLPT